MDKNIKNIISKAKHDKEIFAVTLFGSSLKRKGRDIDICLFLDKKYTNLEMSKKKLPNDITLIVSLYICDILN